MNIRQLAKICKVSIMTVSRAFRNQQVSADTRRVVLATAKKYNYRPNIIARSLVRKRSQVIGLVVPNMIQSYFPHIIMGVENFFNRFGYNLILCDSREDIKKEEEQIRLLIDQRVAGIMVIPSAKRNGTNVFGEMKQAGVPFVLVDRHLKGVKASFVGVDNYEGGIIAASHLINLGHRRILHLMGPKTASMAQERYMGYRDAFRQAKIEFDPGLVVENGLDEESGYRSMIKALEARKEFTAVFAVNDPVAVGAMKALNDSELRVPEDISLVGFANLDYTPYLKVPLTTINQPKEEVGEIAGKLLLQHIEGRKKTQKILIKTELVLRGSTDTCVEVDSVSAEVE